VLVLPELRCPEPMWHGDRAARLLHRARSSASCRRESFRRLIIRYNASTVPILQLSVHSPVLTEQQLYDYAQNFIRTQLATVQGASIPLPYGGKVRQIMVDLNPSALYAKHLSGTDVSNAINAQSLILPAGNAQIGTQEYLVKLNSSPGIVSALNDLRIKSVNGSIVYIRDVAEVRDGYAIQTNIVRIDGTRGTLLTVLKSGNPSRLSIISQVKAALPRILAGPSRVSRLSHTSQSSVICGSDFPTTSTYDGARLSRSSAVAPRGFIGKVPHVRTRNRTGKR
jgi:multidrug efflux pump subunit AcrB